MNTAAKIRWLLTLICFSLFLTAIISKQTYSPRSNLESSAKTLENTFSSDLLEDNIIDIADFTDHNIYAIHTFNNVYLFSVKLKVNDLNHVFAYIQILLWLSGMLLLCTLINTAADYVSKKGHIFI